MFGRRSSAWARSSVMLAILAVAHRRCRAVASEGAMTVDTIAERLGIRAGTTLWFQPVEWLRVLGPLPPGVRMTGEFAGASVAVLFVSNAESMQWFFRRYGTVVLAPTAVWICAPN